VATLAQWEDDFDSIISADDDDDTDELLKNPPRKKRGRKHTPYKSGGRRKSSGMSRPRKSRRDSSDSNHAKGSPIIYERTHPEGIESIDISFSYCGRNEWQR
jgi:hypothetical protein